MRKALVLLLVFAVVSAVWVSWLGTVDAQEGPTATRSFSPTVSAGDELVVTITVSGYGSFGNVKETLPEGFVYVSSSLSGGITLDDDGRRVAFTVSEIDSFTYTVTAPVAGGSYIFQGVLKLFPQTVDYTVGGETEVTVEAAPPPPGLSATRTFDPESVVPDGQVVVTVEAEGYGSFGQVVETLPEGFTYGSTSLADGAEVDGQTVAFTLLVAGPTTFTYTVTAPNTPGPYPFRGIVEDADLRQQTVGGETEVTVEAAPPPPGLSATRTFDPESVVPDGQVVVTVEAEGYGSFGQVVETLPEGFTYGSTSLADGAEVDGQTVAFTLLVAGPTTFTYTVTAPNTPGPYPFRGIVEDADLRQQTVGGETEVTVEAAPPPPGLSATRTFDRESVVPDGQVVVTVEAEGYGSFGQVVETLPEGFAYGSTSLADGAEVDGQTVCSGAGAPGEPGSRIRWQLDHAVHQ